MRHPIAKNIPRPWLRIVENLTPFSHFQCDKMGPRRRFYDTVVVKGCFALTPGTLDGGGPTQVALADEYWNPDAPERSSLRTAGDVLLSKPGTDIIVTGTARPPGGRAQSAWEAGVVVKSTERVVVRSVLRATGPRYWEHRAVRGWALSDPQPTTGVEIRYELAYGGAYRRAESHDDWTVDSANPSGKGFVDLPRLDRSVPHPAPQWERLDDPATALNRSIGLAGFVPVPPPP